MLGNLKKLRRKLWKLDNIELDLYVSTILTEVRLQKLQGELLTSDTFESYSAGTETKTKIKQDVVRLIKKYFSIDMEKI